MTTPQAVHHFFLTGGDYQADYCSRLPSIQNQLGAVKAYLLLRDISFTQLTQHEERGKNIYLLALVFLLLRLRRRTRFFLHLARILRDGQIYSELKPLVR